MSEVKPVIKTEAQRISDRYSEKTIKYLADHVFLKEARAEAAELRAALEALQAKYEGSLDSIREHQQICRDLKQENAEQAKRIAELEDTFKMLAHRAKHFPSYPIGTHIPEVFEIIGEAQNENSNI